MDESLASKADGAGDAVTEREARLAEKLRPISYFNK